MAKKTPFSMEFDMQLKDFKFTKESFFKGANKPTNSGWKKLRFTYYLDKKGHILVNPSERKIDFHFTLEMHPDLGEINFDGECVLESPEQNKIQFCFTNQVPPFMQFINRIILKKCYKTSKKIAEINNIPFPPIDYLMRLPVKK